MEKTAARPEAVKDAGRTRQSEIGYLLSEKKLLTAIGGFDPEYLNKELPKVEQRLRELGVKADEPEARREGGAGVQKETRLGEGGAAEARREAPAQEKPALPAIQEAKAEKEAEKVPLSWKDTFKSKFSASIRSFFDAIDVDTILWDARVEIQKKFKARQEALWGEEAVGGIIHSHSARGENYVGSDGAIPVEMIYRVVKAAGGGFVVLTDHDIFKPEDLSRLAEAADKSNKSQGAVSVFCGSEMTSGIEGEPGKLNKGHFVIWSIGKPLENDDLSDFLEPNITPSKMAEWAFKLSTVGRGIPVLLETIVGGTHSFLAKLFFTFSAGFTFTTGINKAADADRVAYFPFCYMDTCPDYGSNNFMSGNHRKH